MGKAAIEIQGVTKYFGEEMILKNITHTFESGKIHGIVGMNGSGKTVLLKCICGFLRPSEGKILVEGKWIGKERDFPESLGMRERLGIAQAIMEDPHIIILDEPFNGLDKNGVQEVYRIIQDLKNEQRTILLVSHNRVDIETLCDTVCEMELGVLRRIL